MRSIVSTTKSSRESSLVLNISSSLSSFASRVISVTSFFRRLLSLIIISRPLSIPSPSKMPSLIPSAYPEIDISGVFNSCEAFWKNCFCTWLKRFNSPAMSYTDLATAPISPPALISLTSEKWRSFTFFSSCCSFIRGWISFFVINRPNRSMNAPAAPKTIRSLLSRACSIVVTALIGVSRVSVPIGVDFTSVIYLASVPFHMFWRSEV
ncbi:hypothetical protein D3C78_881170 [compost metagenome]